MNSFGLPKMLDTRYIRLWSCKAYTKNAIDKELSLSIFAKAAKRTSRKWGAFFAFASADICFTCRYLAVYLCFLSAFGYSHLFAFLLILCVFFLFFPAERVSFLFFPRNARFFPNTWFFRGSCGKGIVLPLFSQYFCSVEETRQR